MFTSFSNSSSSFNTRSSSNNTFVTLSNLSNYSGRVRTTKLTAVARENIYRRKEIELWQRMKKISITILAMNVLAYVLTLISRKFDIVFLYFNGYIFYPSLFIAVLVSYVQIYYLMRKLHKYEFDKNRKSMKLFVTFATISNIFNVIHFGSAAYFGYYLKQTDTPNI